MYLFFLNSDVTNISYPFFFTTSFHTLLNRQNKFNLINNIIKILKTQILQMEKPVKPIRKDDSKNAVPIHEIIQKAHEDHSQGLSQKSLLPSKSKPEKPSRRKSLNDDESILAVETPTNSSKSLNPINSSKSSQGGNNPFTPDSKESVEIMAPRIIEENNPIYHKTKFSPIWMYLAIFLHIGQCIFLFVVGQRVLSQGVFVFLVLLSVLITVLLILSRFSAHVRNIGFFELRRKEHFTPDDEKDDVPDRGVYYLSLAGVLVGCLYAIFSACAVNVDKNLNQGGFYTQNTLIQSLRFGSIILLAFHRVIRPANRVDPMRTMLEVMIILSTSESFV